MTQDSTTPITTGNAQIDELISSAQVFFAENAAELAMNLLAAAAIFVIGKWVAKKLTNVVKRLMLKGNVDETLVVFFGNIIYFALIAFVCIAALGRLGVETASLAAIIAAAGLAIGLALQGSLSNLASGVMIILFRPFKLGDFIEGGGATGGVEDISIFTTTLKTPDNKKVIVPNGQIIGGVITNFSAKPTRRIDMVLGVSYNDDLKKVHKIIKKIIDADDRILKDPECQIAVSELADSSINFVVRPWAKTEDYWAVRFDFLENIKIAFDKEGIEIPFPQRSVHHINPAPVKETKTTKKKAA